MLNTSPYSGVPPTGTPCRDLYSKIYFMKTAKIKGGLVFGRGLVFVPPPSNREFVKCKIRSLNIAMSA